MRIITSFKWLGHGLKCFLALSIIWSTTMWAGPIHSRQLNSAQPPACTRLCGSPTAHIPHAFRKPQPISHCTLADDFYMGPEFFEFTEDHDFYHALARSRRSSGLVRFQFERHGKQPPEFLYPAPKLYLCQQSLLC